MVLTSTAPSIDNTPLSAYIHDDLLWLIEDHLLTLVAKYPSFSLSDDDFTHNDGTTVRLLNVTGVLSRPQSSSSAPSIPLTIWLHQNYPYHPPLVFISLPSAFGIPKHHPFVDPDGATTCPYIDEWEYPKSDLSGLVLNLITIFDLCPLYPSSATVSRRDELVDELIWRVSCDLTMDRDQVSDNAEMIFAVQSELRDRESKISSEIAEIEREKWSVEESLSKMRMAGDELEEWVNIHNEKISCINLGDLLEGVDTESRRLLDNEAVDLAIEDALYLIDKEFSEGSVGLCEYLKQVRGLSREQFYHRATVVNLQANSHILING